MSNKNIGVIALIAIIFAGGGFYGGIKYQQSKVPVRAGGQFMLNGAATGTRRVGGQQAAGFVNGEVISQDSSSLTIKNMAGGSQIIILSPSTQYKKAVDGSQQDLTVGKSVTITGSNNSDGSLTAQNVQIRDASSTPPTGFNRPR
jgi:hypothetical protein